MIRLRHAHYITAITAYCVSHAPRHAIFFDYITPLMPTHQAFAFDAIDDCRRRYYYFAAPIVTLYYVERRHFRLPLTIRQLIRLRRYVSLSCRYGAEVQQEMLPSSRHIQMLRFDILFLTRTSFITLIDTFSPVPLSRDVF